MKIKNNIRIIKKSTIRHLRFHFSFFLLPVFVFALSQAADVNWTRAVLSFFILHFLVFPSSNGYNSYQDKDTTPIGGLKNPPAVTRNLYYTTLFFDALAIGLGLLISVTFSLMMLVFVMMSRAYSYRGIRLKKYPVTGYLTVFIFQGGFIYLVSLHAITGISLAQFLTIDHLVCAAVSSLFIGSMYPLTQIYQHESDRKDGVVSISYMLGYQGTFIFSGIMFAIATVIMVLYFLMNNHPLAVILFLLFVLPMAYRMSRWFSKVRKDNREANFENAMAMNMVSSSSMNLYFFMLVVINNETWF